MIFDGSSLSLVSIVLVIHDDFIIMSNLLEDLKYKLQAWKSSLEMRVLRIKVRKTKILGLSSEAQKSTTNAKWQYDRAMKSVLIQYFARVVNSGFITDARK